MLHDILWYTIVSIVFASWYLYIFETLSKIRKYRSLYLRDWGFGAFQPFKNLARQENLWVNSGSGSSPIVRNSAILRTS